LLSVCDFVSISGVRSRTLDVNECTLYCSLTNKWTFIKLGNFNLRQNTHNNRSYMFRSATILRELVQSLAKVVFLLKHSVNLCCCIMCRDVAACREMERVLFVVQIHTE
jgi:hypothetical protein